MHRLVLRRERRFYPGGLAYASFELTGDKLVPSFWTRFFRRSPTHKHVKGGVPCIRQDYRSLSPAVPRLAPYRTGEWSLTSRARIDSDDLDAHLGYLIERLRFPRIHLQHFMAEDGLTARVVCFWDNARGDRMPVIDPALRKVFADSGVPIAIDEYPRPITVTDGDKTYQAWL